MGSWEASRARGRVFFIGALTVSACGAGSPTSYIEKHKAEVQPRIDAIRRVAADAASHRVKTPALSAPTPMVFCDLVMPGALDGDRPCNTRMLYLAQVEDPSKEIVGSVQLGLFNSWFTDSVSYIERGTTAATEQAPAHAPERADIVASAFDQLQATAYVVLVKPIEESRYQFSAEAFVYALPDGAPIGEFTFGAQGQQDTYVEVGGAHAGSIGAVVDTTANNVRHALEDRVLKLAPSARFLATTK